MNAVATKWEIACLIGGGLSFALALVSVCPIRRTPFWMLSLGATEFGHWLAFVPGAIAGLLLASGSARTLPGIAALAFTLAAAGLFVLPVVRAIWLARRVPLELWAAFGAASESAALLFPAPFSLARLWRDGEPQAPPPEPMIYAEHGGAELRLDFYRSRTSVSAPCVIVLHTGGWNNGAPDEFMAFNHWLGRRGYAVAALQYRLAPRWRWPAQGEDVVAAIRFLKERSAALGIDPGNFVLLGRSAGGQIAEAVAYGGHDPAIRACIAFYAPSDMNFSYEHSREDDILKSPQLLRNFLGGTPEEAPDNYRAASPCQLVTCATPPTLLLHGTPDPLVWFLQSKRLAARLGEHGVPHYFLELPWATHAFDYNPNGPGGQLSRYAVAWFLGVVTR